MIRRLALASLVVALAIPPASPARAGEVRVASAANFAPALERLAAGFEKATGHRVVASSGSTGKLYAQIAQGAPFAVLLAADAATPERLEREGLAVPGSRFTYAVGRLALWSPDAGTVDGEGAVLRRGEFRHLALANPRIAPYGAAAREALERLGLWDGLVPRLVFGEDVAQAFGFVATRNAELGLVALAQVRALPPARRGSWWTVPAELHAPIEQQAVLLGAGRDDPAARAFLDHLRSAAARAIVVGLGYDDGGAAAP